MREIRVMVDEGGGVHFTNIADGKKYEAWKPGEARMQAVNRLRERLGRGPARRPEFFERTDPGDPE